MESKPSLPQESAGNSNLTPVVIKKELLSLIRTVKKIQVIPTYKEVLEGLKMYVWEKKLCDPSNPFRVCCKGDALSSVFGVEEFTVFDIKTFLQKLVTPVNKISNLDTPEALLQSVSGISVKRKLGDSEDHKSDQKNMKTCAIEVDKNKHAIEVNESKHNTEVYGNKNAIEVEEDKCSVEVTMKSPSPLVLHIPQTPEKCDSSDSADSIQGYETAYVKDPSDHFSSAVDSDDFFSNEGRIIAVEETFDIEYTDFSSDDDETFSSSSSDSDSETEIKVALDAAILSFVCRTDSDIEFFADNSSDEDVEIPESDHWKCLKCNFSNRPTMRYCSKCWKERLIWFSETPKHIQRIPPSRRKRKSRRSRTSGPCRSSSQEMDEADFTKSSQDSQGSGDLEISPETSSLLTSTNPYLVSSSNAVPKLLCMICCEKPADASIIHSKYAHQICCYRCASKLKKQKKRCPVCRRTIDRVVHQISSI